MVSAEQEALIYRLDGEGMPPIQIAMVVSLSVTVVIGVLHGHIRREACRVPEYIPTKAEIKAATREIRRQQKAKINELAKQRKMNDEDKLIRKWFLNYPD